MRRTLNPGPHDKGFFFSWEVPRSRSGADSSGGRLGGGGGQCEGRRQPARRTCPAQSATTTEHFNSVETRAPTTSRPTKQDHPEATEPVNAPTPQRATEPGLRPPKSSL